MTAQNDFRGCNLYLALQQKEFVFSFHYSNLASTRTISNIFREKTSVLRRNVYHNLIFYNRKSFLINVPDT